MGKLLVIFILMLLLSASTAETIAQKTTISTSDTFTIPALNSQISFFTDLNYTNANLENNTWSFTGLHASGKGGYPIHGNLHISAQNCSVVITYLQAWTQPEAPNSGATGMQWIKYNVIGKGTQTLDAVDLFPNSVNYTQWTVRINGEPKQIGDCWNYSDAKLLTIAPPKPGAFVEISMYHVPLGSDMAPLPAPEPALNNFVSADCFQILSSNGSLNFGASGSFDSASLDNDTWNFVNLTLSNYAINAGVFAPYVTGRNVLPYIVKCGYPASLGVSAVNSNVTITGINPLTWESYTPELNYTVQGIGSQIFTLPFRLSSFNWTVYIDGVSKSNNDGWFLIGDYQLKVTNATSNVAIEGVAIPNDWSPKVYSPFSPLIFSLAVGVTIILITIVIVFLVIRGQRAKNKIHD